jgi:hypothetical protein
LYRISDNFLRFQFGRILPVIDYYDEEDSSETIGRILKGLETDMGTVFEQVCGQHLRRRHRGKLGRWWGPDPVSRTQEEIDLILTTVEDGKRIGWFAECKYRNEPVGVDVLDTLKRRASLVRGFDESRFIIYAKCGFTENLERSGAAELNRLEDVLYYPK